MKSSPSGEVAQADVDIVDRQVALARHLDKIVADHGSTMTLESAPDRGTTARIFLPIETALPRLKERAPEMVRA